MWGRDTSLLEWIQRIKGSLVLDTKRGRQMSFLKGADVETHSQLYTIERENLQRLHGVWSAYCLYWGELNDQEGGLVIRLGL